MNKDPADTSPADADVSDEELWSLFPGPSTVTAPPTTGGGCGAGC